MATDTNVNVPVTKGPLSGIKVGSVFRWMLTPAIQVAGVFRGFGGPTADSDDGDTSAQHMHLATAETYDDDWDVGVEPLSTTAERVDFVRGGATANAVLTNRKVVVLRNKSTTISIYYAKTNAVTSTGSTIGGELLPGAMVRLPFGENMTVWAIAASGAPDLEVFQIA